LGAGNYFTRPLRADRGGGRGRRGVRSNGQKQF